MLTSLKSAGSGAFDWMGGIAAQYLKWSPSQPSAADGACAGITGLGLKAEDCDTLHNFVCEEKPKITTLVPTM